MDEARSSRQQADDPERERSAIAKRHSAAERQGEIDQLRTDVRERQVELAQVQAELRERRILTQQQAALLAQTNAMATAYKAELDDLKSGSGWMMIILIRQFERQFPLLGRLARRLLRVVWRTIRFIRSRLRRANPTASPLSQPKPSTERTADAWPASAGTKGAEDPRLDPMRETVLLIVHDASRTGGPILAYNIAKRLSERQNVVALLLAGGELVDDFRDCCAAVVGPLSDADLHPAQLHLLVDRLEQTYRITYAIANSIASRMMLRPLTLARIPVVALVHEFPGYMLLQDELGPALEWATLTVFSSEMTAAAARASHQKLVNCPVFILRQGRPDLPPREGAAIDEERDLISLAMRPDDRDDAFVVLGVGTLNIRKGVDVFLSTAAAVAALHPKRRVRFVWIGSPRQDMMDRIYASFVEEQVARSGLKQIVTFIGDVADLDPAYELADMFFMCSRLDPLPNVAIEAALRGLPVLCFKDASGVAEVLAEDPVASAAVVPYLDAHAAAREIVALADDRAAYDKMSEVTQRLAQRAFDMDEYVRRLDDLGHQAMALIDQRRKDYETISNDPAFDLNHGGGPYNGVSTRDEAIRLFLARSMVHGIGRSTNFNYRRPCPGFHPQIYEHENAANYDRAKVNPLAQFIRSGKPNGPWRHEVINPADGFRGGPADTELRIVLHGHFYYPDLAGEFLRKLAKNRLRCDLLLSTGTEGDAALLAKATSDFDRGKVTIRTVPNRGRDIGPLLTLFASEVRDNYDIVGHIHGKRSLFLGDPTIGETWREFLWQNLLGDDYAMADVIVSRMTADKRLGLVFPDDPHLSDWDENLELATDFAERMGIVAPLPPFFDFPVGTMFWARTGALKPLFDLNLSWEDYPREPVHHDGTALHAIERLLPFAAGHAGYRYATTYVPGITW